MSVRLAVHLAEKISSYPPGTTFLFRRGRTTPIGSFEKVASGIANALGYGVQFCVPDEGDRAAVFRRDYEMVEASDEVEAYFTTDTVMTGGTGHVVEAALARDVPVHAWEIDSAGKVNRVGEIEPG